MQARIHKYVSNSRNPDELRSSGRAMLAELGSMPGLVSFVMLDVGEGQLVSVCICEEAAMLDAVDTVAAAWLGAHVDSAVAPIDVISGPILLQRGL